MPRVELDDVRICRGVAKTLLHELHGLVVFKPQEPDGPISFPCLSLWRVISGCRLHNRTWSTAITMLFGPLGMICRTPSVFICRCTTKFGHIVSIVADHGESNSRTKSRNRSSRNLNVSLKARISPLSSAATDAYFSSGLFEAI